MEIKEIISSGLLEMYVLGLTSTEETVQVETWIKTYPEMALELSAIEASLESYAMADAVEPPKGLEDKIFASLNPIHHIQAIQNNGIPAKVYSISPFWKMAIAATVILFVGSSILNS